MYFIYSCSRTFQSTIDRPNWWDHVFDYENNWDGFSIRPNGKWFNDRCKVSLESRHYNVPQQASKQVSVPATKEPERFLSVGLCGDWVTWLNLIHMFRLTEVTFNKACNGCFCTERFPGTLMRTGKLTPNPDSANVTTYSKELLIVTDYQYLQR